MEDNLTGAVLDLTRHFTNVRTRRKGGTKDGGYFRVRNVHDLAKLLLGAHQNLAAARSCSIVQSQPVLVCAAAGTGKTCFVRQLFYDLANGVCVHKAAAASQPWGMMPVAPL